MLFAVGTVLGLTDNDGVSTLAAIVGYVVMLGTMGVMANTLGVETKSIMGINSIDTGVFGGILAGGFLFKMFGLPAAAIAMWHSATTKMQKRVGGIMISAALTSMLTGITEPIEFSFLFVAPVLYAIHAVLAGVAFMITNALEIKMGASFSHGLIDFTLFSGIGTKSFMLIPLGLAYAAVYYTVFRFAISKFNLKTPGREDDAEMGVKVEVNEQLAKDLIIAFGGNSNIKSIDACITRLRVTVNKPESVDQKRIKALGARAVMVVGQLK